MELQWECANETLTVSLVGELDHHAAASIREQIDTEVVRRSAKMLVLDFAKLSFMDSSGIGLIMGRYRLMQTRKGKLSVRNLSPRYQQMARMAGLEKLGVLEPERTDTQ